MNGDKSESELKVGLKIGEKFKLLKMAQWSGCGPVFTGIKIDTKQVVTIAFYIDDRFKDESYFFQCCDNAKKVREACGEIVLVPDEVGIYENIPYCVYYRGAFRYFEQFFQSVKKKFTVTEVKSIVEPILKLLVKAHKTGIFHLGLSSLSICRKEGSPIIYQPEILDFAMTPQKGDSYFTLPATKDSKLLHVVSYVSPEQVEGKNDADLRADLYSLGCFIYRLVSGKSTFDGKSIDEIKRKVVEEVPDELKESASSELQSGMKEFLVRALQKDPDMRFSSASEMLESFYGSLISVGERKEEAKPTFKSKPAEKERGSGASISGTFDDFTSLPLEKKLEKKEEGKEEKVSGKDMEVSEVKDVRATEETSDKKKVEVKKEELVEEVAVEEIIPVSGLKKDEIKPIEGKEIKKIEGNIFETQKEPAEKVDVLPAEIQLDKIGITGKEDKRKELEVEEHLEAQSVERKDFISVDVDSVKAETQPVKQKKEETVMENKIIVPAMRNGYEVSPRIMERTQGESAVWDKAEEIVKQQVKVQRNAFWLWIFLSFLSGVVVSVAVFYVLIVSSEVNRINLLGLKIGNFDDNNRGSNAVSLIGDAACIDVYEEEGEVSQDGEMEMQVLLEIIEEKVEEKAKENEDIQLKHETVEAEEEGLEKGEKIKEKESGMKEEKVIKKKKRKKDGKSTLKGVYLE